MDCDACHTADDWKLSSSASGGSLDHARTGFPLLGAHVTTGRVFKGAPRAGTLAARGLQPPAPVHVGGGYGYGGGYGDEEPF